MQSVPDRRTFAALVGRTLAYPRTMMTCLPEVAVAALEARGSRHLWATFGAFRGRGRIVGNAELLASDAAAARGAEADPGPLLPRPPRAVKGNSCLD